MCSLYLSNVHNYVSSYVYRCVFQSKMNCLDLNCIVQSADKGWSTRITHAEIDAAFWQLKWIENIILVCLDRIQNTLEVNEIQVMQGKVNSWLHVADRWRNKTQ